MATLQTTIAVRVDATLLEVVDAIIKARTALLRRFERPPTRSDIVRELISAGIGAQYPEPPPPELLEE